MGPSNLCFYKLTHPHPRVAGVSDKFKHQVNLSGLFRVGDGWRRAPYSRPCLSPCHCPSRSVSVTSEATRRKHLHPQRVPPLLPPVPSGSEADKAQTAEKRRAAQLEALSSLLTDHKAWEVCSGLTGRNIHCSFCWRGSHGSGQITYSSSSTQSPGAFKKAASAATRTDLETVVLSEVNPPGKEE